MTEAKLYTICGETMTLREFSEKYKIPKYTIRFRIVSGMPEETILLPVGELPREFNRIGYTEQQKQHAQSLSWTATALDCYEIGAVCSKCLLPIDIQKKCKMKKTIREIVREYGKPYDRSNNFI